MFDFLSRNIGTIIVLVVLSVAVFFICRNIYKNKKSGKSMCSGCSGGCSGCAMAGKCHTEDKK